ncbi:MAG: DUF2147 domain-containing protein [Bacteroidetes bacterium]|nr:DUF2147 domain-containing protein [Bacteroidota bacterium]
MGFLASPFVTIQAQEVKADDILGVWLNEDKDAHVDIYMEGDKFYGKVVWLDEPIDEETGEPKLDDENEDESLRSRPIMGLLLLRDFVFDGDDEWEDGRIYDPKNGKDYKCYMEFPDEDDKNTLKVRGYIGFSMIGRTTYWTRVE